MYELQSTLAAYARRKFSSGEISVDHLKNILKVKIVKSTSIQWLHILSLAFHFNFLNFFIIFFISFRRSESI